MNWCGRVGGFFLCLLVCFMNAQRASGQDLIRMARSISQYGITWTFDREYSVGRYVTGDYWVAGPVTVVAITPAGGGGRNGSMVNPMPGKYQAYDNRNAGYRLDLLKKTPFKLSPDESLVSTVSIERFPYTDLMGRKINSGQGYTRQAAILTCVGSLPDADEFRPPYIGRDKKTYLKTNLQRKKLSRLPAPAGSPGLGRLERYFQRPWIDHQEGWNSRLMHPADNMPNYGRELATVIGDAGLELCLDYTDAQKEKVLIGLVQVGIDNYHTALLNKHLWASDGGHMIGRKFPILFAGLMLNDGKMLTLNDYDSQEDMSTYFGGQSQTLWTGWQASGHPYASNVLYQLRAGVDLAGKPWHHEDHHPRNWGSGPFPNNPSSPQYPYQKHEGYRRLASLALPGQTIAARILGLVPYWNHPAYFSYVDRWMYEDDRATEKTIKQYWPDFYTYRPGGINCQSAFAKKMYLLYRAKF